uniref:DUF3037 domain-containing protein n=1 Tax=Marinobacterium profundum TaxID=1714300 RepID=UPI00082F4D9A|nr:DUF3037 domain-containing protein [Marinobacterium profundum]
MNSGLRGKLRTQGTQRPVTGNWRSIQFCIDEDTREFFNVGVVFSNERDVEVRMLDSFDRLGCLFDNRVDKNWLSHTLHDIESTILEMHGNLPDNLGHNIKIGAPLYAAGMSSEQIVDEFFDHVVTLARPKNIRESQRFRYRSTSKVRHAVVDHIKESIPLEAGSIVQLDRYVLRLNAGGKLDLDIPLMSARSASTIVSGWYKNPLVVENSLLKASADLNLVRSNTDRQTAAVSVLVPDTNSGLSRSEFNKLNTATMKQLDRIKAAGIEVITAPTTQELASQTSDWWMQQAS